MNEDSAKSHAAAMAAVCKIWNINSFYEAFPENMRPEAMGLTAVTIVKQIAVKIPDLAEAQRLFSEDFAANTKKGLTAIGKPWGK